jgi:hypothetical protein
MSIATDSKGNYIMSTVEQVRAFGAKCLQHAAECREKGWPEEYENSYLSTAADIASVSDLELLEPDIL